MKCFALGIIGNFHGHLSSAERQKEHDIPVGIFVVNSLDNNIITDGDILKFPPKGGRIQAEPEFVVTFRVEYLNYHIESLKPVRMTIGNDMTIRELENSTKIVERKIWGENSKGLAVNSWKINDLDVIGENYKLRSFIKRHGSIMEYTDEADVSGLKIFGEPLCKWLVNQINTQCDDGICKEILPQIIEANFPDEIMVYCGAPNYTSWGNSEYIKPGDEISIILVDIITKPMEVVYNALRNGELINDGSVISYQQTVVN
ncbi:DUF5718 family protein [Vibrio mediterranei]|uniref:DUF5718 family protein n=1 Tax=Vibrio mediterranei TaxID=689 RepID=UPI00148E5248|nr:DUF5718 family protein [Vibrio mediterranei]NOI26664.1 hypothetical protein [Vibrio mediterranei]